MTNRAQRWVAVAQNSLLADLVARLPFPVFICLNLFFIDEFIRPGVALAVFACEFLLFAVAWVVGVWSIEAPRNGPAPPGGLQVWTLRPTGGARPPRWIRSAVRILGRKGSRKDGWLRHSLSACCVGALVLFWLHEFDRLQLASFSPILAGPNAGAAFVWAAMAAMFASLVRSWAIDSREYLEADAAASPGFGRDRNP